MPEAGVGWLVIHFYSIECHGPNTLDERSPKQISTIVLFSFQTSGCDYMRMWLPINQMSSHSSMNKGRVVQTSETLFHYTTQTNALTSSSAGRCVFVWINTKGVKWRIEGKTQLETGTNFLSYSNQKVVSLCTKIISQLPLIS